MAQQPLLDEELKTLRTMVDKARGGEWALNETETDDGTYKVVSLFPSAWYLVCEVDSTMNNSLDTARFIAAARSAVPALLDEVERRQTQIDNLGNDMAVIQDAIATGFWNIENIWLHIKTEEGDELARDVQQLWLGLMWADFVRANAHDHWDGFKFTPPQPSEPVRFFSDEARKALGNEYPPS